MLAALIGGAGVQSVRRIVPSQAASSFWPTLMTMLLRMTLIVINTMTAVVKLIGIVRLAFIVRSLLLVKLFGQMALLMWLIWLMTTRLLRQLLAIRLAALQARIL